MQLRTYSDRHSQALHLTQYVQSAPTLLTPGDQVTQPLWLRVVIYFPDACRSLRIGPNAVAALVILLEALRRLQLEAEVIQQLLDADCAKVELHLGADAATTICLASASHAARNLTLGPQAEAHLVVKSDGTGSLALADDALAHLTLTWAYRGMEIKPDASRRIVVGVCDDE